MEIIKINKYTQHSSDEKKREIIEEALGGRGEEGNRKSQEIIDAAINRQLLLVEIFVHIDTSCCLIIFM